PHVAGAAALYLQNNTDATPAEVATALINTSTANVVTGAGLGSPNRLLYTTSLQPGGAGGEVTVTPTPSPSPSPSPSPTPSPSPSPSPTPGTPVPTPEPGVCTELC